LLYIRSRAVATFSAIAKAIAGCMRPAGIVLQAAGLLFGTSMKNSECFQIEWVLWDSLATLSNHKSYWQKFEYIGAISAQIHAL